MKNHIKFKSIAIIFTLFFSCSDSDEVSPLTIIESSTIANTTFTSIDVNADVSLNGSEIMARGICWSVNPNPTIIDNITVESTNQFTSSITALTANTTFYYRVYATTNSETIYGQEHGFSTLSFDNTEWIFDTKYEGDFSIFSKIEFYDDGTTKFDELDLPGQAPGVFITYGTWSLEGNILTYNFDSTNQNDPVYIYTGAINGSALSGEYSHSSAPNGTWTAELQ